MPFKSKSQERYMFSQHPKIAKKWAKEYPNQGKLPEHTKKHSVKQNRHKQTIHRIWSGKRAS